MIAKKDFNPFKKSINVIKTISLCFFQAINNLVVLAREEAGAQKICQEETLHQLKKLLDDKDVDLVLASIRVLSGVTNKSKTRVSQNVQQLQHHFNNFITMHYDYHRKSKTFGPVLQETLKIFYVKSHDMCAPHKYMQFNLYKANSS